MSDVLSEITLNGETTRVMKIGGGPGEWEGTIDDFAGGMPASGQLLLSMRHVWTSPASNPVSNPDFFIGLCAAGKPYASGSSHAYGTRMFYSSFQKDPFTFTDNGFYTFMFPWKSENGVQAGLGSGYSFWMNRYEIAAGTQPFGCIMQDLGTGNWLWQPITHDGAYNAVDLSQTELESGRIARNPAQTRAVWDANYAGVSNALTLTTGVSFTEPDQVTYGTLDTLNLYWNFPADHFMYIHAIGVQRNIA